jgi:hypothetical protein
MQSSRNFLRSTSSSVFVDLGQSGWNDNGSWGIRWGCNLRWLSELQGRIAVAIVHLALAATVVTVTAASQ